MIKEGAFSHLNVSMNTVLLRLHISLDIKAAKTKVSSNYKLDGAEEIELRF